MTQKLVAKRSAPVDDEVLTTFARTMREGDTVWLLDRIHRFIKSHILSAGDGA